MTRKIVAAAILTTAVASLVAFSPAPTTSAEILRIQAHFDSVLSELRARDVSQLSETQRTNRRAVIRTLAAYRNQAAFPINYEFSAPTPYFVDPGTRVLCAVAHLLEQTGRRDIVDRVAATNNNIWVPQLAGDAEFESWLVRNGLTLTEAARIQVPYMGEPFPVQPVVEPSPSRAQRAVSATGVGLAATVSAMNLLSNRDGHGRIRNAAGLATGLASVGYGAAMLRDENADTRMAIANVATGALSAFVSGRGILRNRQRLAAQREAERTNVALAPVMPSATSGAGVSLNVRF